MTKKQCEQPQPVPELKDPCLSKQLLPFFHPRWRLKEQRPLGLGGARGGEMLQANRGAGPDAAQTSLWHYVFNSSPQVPPWVSLLWGFFFFFFPSSELRSARLHPEHQRHCRIWKCNVWGFAVIVHKIHVPPTTPQCRLRNHPASNIRPSGSTKTTDQEQKKEVASIA